MGPTAAKEPTAAKGPAVAVCGTRRATACEIRTATGGERTRERRADKDPSPGTPPARYRSMPYSLQRRATRSRISGVMRSSFGYSRTIPSPGIFRVASIPIFPPAPRCGAA